MAKGKKIGYLEVINSSPKNKTYSFVAFTLVVVLILLVGAIRPTLLTISRISRDLKEKELINERLEQKLNTLAKLSTDYETIREKVELLPVIYPTQGNFSLFLANIEQISKDNGYTLNAITFGSPNDFDSKLTVLKPWAVRVMVTGSKSNIVRLMSAYEDMPMYPTVNKMSYSNTTTEDGQTQFSLELIIYRIDDPKFYN